MDMLRCRALWRPDKQTAPRLSGLLATLLVAAMVTPVVASEPGRADHQSAQRPQQGVSVARKRSGKNKTITRTFQSGDANGAEISIPAVGSERDFGPADPYPSTIAVSGFKRARIADVNLTLHDLSHSFVADVDVLLVAPDGRNAVVMGDVGAAAGAGGVQNVTVALDDEAATPLPVDALLTSGTFQPLDNLGPVDTDEPTLLAFPAPAPEPSGESALSTFDGADPNGGWQLFILDDTEDDAGQLGDGWSLQITATSKVKDRHRHKHGRRH